MDSFTGFIYGKTCFQGRNTCQKLKRGIASLLFLLILVLFDQIMDRDYGHHQDAYCFDRLDYQS